MDEGDKSPQEMLEDCRNRLAALGINAPKFDMNADEADDRLKAIQNKLRFISLYEKSRRQPKEIRLLRFLCYGDETPLYQPGSRMQPNRLAKYRSEVVDEYLQEIENEREKVLQAGCPKMPTVEELPLFKAIEVALMDDSRPFRECAIYVLAKCARFQAQVPPVDHLKSLAFSLAKKHIKDEQDFFLFVKLAQREEDESLIMMRVGAIESTGEPAAKKTKVGWGKGMRNFVTNWYNCQDPIQLARSISHRKGLYGWAHADLIKLCHIKVKEKESPLAAVLFYALFGFDKTNAVFGSVKNCEQVIAEMKKREQETKADSEALVKLIRSHGLKADEVESEKLSLAVWKGLIENMTAKELLKCFPQLWRLDMEGGDAIWKAAAAVLEKVEEGAQIHPAKVFVTKCDYLKSLANNNKTFDSAHWLKKKEKGGFLIKEPCPIILQMLGKLLEASLKAIKPNGVRVLLTVDLRSSASLPDYHEFPNKCAYTHSVSPLQATALIALCLSRHHKRFTLTALAEGAEDGMQIISVPKTASLETIMEKFEEVKVCKQPKLAAPMIWARERKRDLDAFVLVTPFFKNWGCSEPMASPFVALNMYKEEMKKPDAKFAFCALGNMNVDIAQPPRTVYMMDFVGFDANTIHVLNAFINGELTN